MNKNTYDTINEYCTTKYKGILVQAEKDYVLRKFLDSYYEAIQKFESDNGRKPSGTDEQTIISSLLNESTLLSYTESAKAYYEKFKYSIELEFEKKQKNNNFWGNVWNSIVANFIYSILLIIVFYVAKDQISSWLLQLTAK